MPSASAITLRRPASGMVTMGSVMGVTADVAGLRVIDVEESSPGCWSMSSTSSPPKVSLPLLP